MKQRRIRVRAIAVTCATMLTLMLVSTMSSAGETLARVKSKGILRCGISEGLLGFSSKDKKGRWTGLDADFCRAVATATLGSPEKVIFVPLSAAARFPALLSGEIDLLLRNTTWTLGREALLGVLFAGTFYYDGQAFMVPTKSNIRKVSDLNGGTICVAKGTTHMEGLEDYFWQHGLHYRPLILEHLAEVEDAFFGGHCQALTSDRSELAAIRLGVLDGETKFTILPEVISKEPLGPVVKRGDEEWFLIVRWVLFALIQAEELGITKDNVGAARSTTAPGVSRFLGTNNGVGKALGIYPDWTVRVIQNLGNYGEMFERNLGRQSSLRLDRGLNRLWTEGGLMYAPPFR